MKTPLKICSLTSLSVLLLLHYHILRAQSQYENPWSNGKPEVVQNLAYERHPVEGFAWPTSVLPGDTIRFYISTMYLLPQNPLSQDYEMKIFRSPDFGSGQELYAFSNTTGHFYPLRAADGDSIFPGQTNKRPIDYRLGCKDYWAPTARTLVVPSNWSSGLYFARLNHLTLNDPTKYYYIPFVVRAANPGIASKILFKFDLNTHQAYNYWGGGSLYSLGQDPTTLTSDSIIALDRPINGDISHYAAWYYVPFERTLRDSGYVLEYCNNLDIDSTSQNPNELIGLNLLKRYQVLVMMNLMNHDEYWSSDERNYVETFKGSPPLPTLPSGLHGNIARFTANTCYWRITWIGSGSKYLKLKCRKDNYAGGGHPPYDLWRYPTGQGGAGRPEAKFLASQYETGWNDVNADSTLEQPADQVYSPAHWIFKHANLDSVGQEFGFGTNYGWQRGIVSNKVDNTITARADFPLDTLAQRLVRSRVDTAATPPCPCYRDVLHQMVYYEDTLSNARVFAQGAMGWMYSLVNEPGTIDPNDVIRMKTITINIISHFSGKKYLGNVWTGADFPLEWNSPIRLDGNVTVPANRYLKISNPAIVTIDSTFFVQGTVEITGNVTLTGSGSITVGLSGRIILTSSSSLTLDAGVTTILERDSAIQFGSGSSLEVKGLLRTTYGNYTTIPYGSTLRIRPGATLQWGSYGRLVVEGTLSAIGTANNPITITKAPGELAPGGIELAYGSTDTLEYCRLSELYTGVSIAYCTAILRNNQFTNCTIAISSDAYKRSPIIEDNTIDSCWIGLDVFTSSILGVPSIQRNTITACTYGIILNSSYK